MRKLWYNLSHLGLSGQEESGNKRIVILTNRLVLIAFIIHLIYLPIVFLLKLEEAYITSLLFPTALFYLFYLLKKNKFQVVAVLLILIEALHAVYLSIIGETGHLHLALIPLFIFNLALVQNKHIKHLMSILIFGLFLLSEYFQYIYSLEFNDRAETFYYINIFNNVLVISICAYAVYHLKRTNNEYEKDILLQKAKISSQHSDLNRVHIDIKSSIKYAKRIQTAILPPQRVIKKYLENSFVIYQPKDIIAGDFYWTEVIEDKILFAVADCTGHGVSGAMVSVVCHNALNSAVREYKLSKPCEILEKTREIIIEQFENSGSEMMEGMDIALVSMNTKFNADGLNKINYAGANSALYTVREGSLKIFNPDKQPIGLHHNQFDFTDHEITVKRNDMIYIFTNGYASQFGGPKGKKFKYNAFRRLLESISHQDLDTQNKNLIESFDLWRGKHEQVDDITIIGVKV